MATTPQEPTAEEGGLPPGYSVRWGHASTFFTFPVAQRHLQEKMPDATAITETPTEWMLRNINTFAESFPNWNLDTPEARLRLAQHLGGNWEMVQQAQATAARPPAILPDVRDVITSYEGIVAGLRARVQALADLLEDEVNKDADALAEMRYILREMRKETP